MNSVCLYFHHRPDMDGLNSIFYVGIGTKARSADMWARNPYHLRVTSKVGSKNIKITRRNCTSKQHASFLEKFYIATLLHFDVKLTNLTSGGETGYTLSEESRQKIGSNSKKCLTGRTLPDEVKKKCSDSLKGRAFTNEHRRRISDAMRGKKHSDEHRLKNSLAKQGMQHTDATKLKMSTSRKGHLVSETTRLKISQTLKGKAR